MKLLDLRLLRGPNPYAMQPCCVGVLAMEDGDEIGAPEWPGFVGRLQAAVPGLCGIDAAAPTTLAHVAGRIALALQRGARNDVDFLDVVPSGSDSGGNARRIRLACAYRVEAVGGRALAIAVEAGAALRRAQPWDPEAAMAELCGLVARQAIDAPTAALLDAARRRGIPVLRLSEEERRFQLGWGSRQRRIEALPPQADRGREGGPETLDAWFPRGDDGRIPVVAVTGTNGKTTTTLLIAHALRALGAKTGTTTTSSIDIDARVVERGDCTGYWSARTVLTAPEVEVAVLETARGGMLKRGLAFDRCDVGIVLNVSHDHLGQDGIDTLEELGRVKGLVVETARRAAVLNADDPICVRLARRAPRGTEIIYFGFDAGQGAMAGHLANGGRAIFEHKGMLRWADGDHQVPLVATTQLPSTLSGRARHNVANAMAAFAALLALSVPHERIIHGLSSFTSNEIQNPLRMNVFRSQGVTLMVDYAHNVAAYEAIIATARRLTAGRLLGVVTAPGDRLPVDLEAVGRTCGAGFDVLFVYEMDDRRGRPRGSTAQTIVRGARAAMESMSASDRSARLATMLDVREAIRAALRRAEPGDLIILGCASHLSELREAVGSADLSSVSWHTFGLQGSEEQARLFESSQDQVEHSSSLN